VKNIISKDNVIKQITVKTEHQTQKNKEYLSIFKIVYKNSKVKNKT